ncbi:probable 2-oxoglutarate-dependent dioxygenase At5g05600 [Asparagus officinalis]|uniref:probable 2-oxoglutarate-dependent dioxygenase At5g05600 n=1 Tax=Asparagus officinalis TaxID=4686 RepID=UPI00098E5F2D|nr:probable 2-oxoglutarate-dependent dioxygenase At5g05600 [Asparagus officinalis]
MGKEEVVEMVQELAESGQALPGCYILPEKQRPDRASPSALDIPVIDLSLLLRETGCEDDQAKRLQYAVQSWGLFQVIGYDLSPSFLDEVRDVVRKFFQLPMDVKQKSSNLKGEKLEPEGYGNYGVARKDQIIDWNDRLYLSVQPEEKRRLDLWPENPCSFREILHEYTIQTRKVAELVLLALAKLLKLEKNYFVNQLGDTAEVRARFNYYPRCSRPDLVLGINPHSDGSLITILLPDKEVEGLQVLRDGDWFKVPIIPHALLINLGNQIQIMSNGIFKSPVHRVTANSEKDRISVAMFYSLEPEKTLEAAEGVVDETRPCLYKKMRVKDFLNIFFEKYTQGVSTIEWARI